MVLDRERGLPMATTHSPGRRVAEVPSRMIGRFRHGILNSNQTMSTTKVRDPDNILQETLKIIP
jgi:hypothetical protein